MKNLIAAAFVCVALVSSAQPYSPPVVLGPVSTIQGFPRGTAVGQTIIWNGDNWVPGSSATVFGTPPSGYALAVSNGTYNGYVLLVGTNGVLTSNGSGITNVPGSAFSFYTIAPHDNGTNFILDFTNGFNAKIALTNDFVMLYHTNGPGDFKIKMRPGGVDRNIWIPTNWVTASTNIVPYLDGATGKYWVYTLTNAANGMGPRVGMLVGSADGIYDTNMVYRFFETP